MINVAVLPEHSDVVAMIGEAAPVVAAGVTLSEVEVPVPQALIPLQTIVPVPEPIVTLSVAEVLEPLQPLPVTDQLYEVAVDELAR